MGLNGTVSDANRMIQYLVDIFNMPSDPNRPMMAVCFDVSASSVLSVAADLHDG